MTLQVEPNTDLVFTGPSHGISTTTLELANSGTDHLAYRLQTTMSKYSSSDSPMGFIQPNAQLSIQITMGPQKTVDCENDRTKCEFMVEWTIVPSTYTDNIGDFWQQDDSDLEDVQSIIMKCVFIDELPVTDGHNDIFILTEVEEKGTNFDHAADQEESQKSQATLMVPRSLNRIGDEKISRLAKLASVMGISLYGKSSLSRRKSSTMNWHLANKVDTQQLQPSSINVHKGDLTTEKTDVVVVCSQSKSLLEAIFKVAGKSVKAVYKTEWQKTPTAPCIVVAAGEHLPSKIIYFIPWQPNPNNVQLRKSIENFVSYAIERAVNENYQSIAFPAIGCGDFDCSIELIAQTTIEEAYRRLSIHQISVSFVIKPDRLDIYDAFLRQIYLRQPSKMKPLSITIGKGTIELDMGDITIQNVDAIIGTSSSELLKDTILKAAGNNVKIMYDIEHENNPNAILSSIPGGLLACKQIFFLKWQPNTNENILQQSVIDFIWNIIQNVISFNFTSIAIPAIGCGQHGCSVNIVIKTMVKEMKNQLLMRKLPLRVIFVVQPERQNIYDEFCKQISASQEESTTSIAYQLPSTWESCCSNQLRLLVLDFTDEYKSIVVKFHQRMKYTNKEVIRIERIQNERWYIQYQAHSREFKRRLNIDTEMCLYHGCSEQAAESIVKDGFNRSFAGLHGSEYGVGVYFSSDAIYSHGYTYPNLNEERCMFVARVLIGKPISGDKSMKTRPVGFDSTTNGTNIFVTYHDAQAFAEYLIIYK